MKKTFAYLSKFVYPFLIFLFLLIYKTYGVPVRTSTPDPTWLDGFLDIFLLLATFLTFAVTLTGVIGNLVFLSKEKENKN